MTDTAYDDRDDEREARDEAEQHLREEWEHEQPTANAAEAPESHPES